MTKRGSRAPLVRELLRPFVLLVLAVVSRDSVVVGGGGGGGGVGGVSTLSGAFFTWHRCAGRGNTWGLENFLVWVFVGAGGAFLMSHALPGHVDGL